MNKEFGNILRDKINLHYSTQIESSIGELSLEACVGLHYCLTNHYHKRLYFDAIDVTHPQLFNSGIDSTIIQLLAEAHIVISPQNSLNQISKAFSVIGEYAFTFFLESKDPNSPLHLDTEIQIIRYLQWRPKIKTIELKFLLKNKIPFIPELSDVIYLWKKGSTYECTLYYNQNISTLTGIHIKANKDVILLYHEKLNQFSVAQIHKTTFNTCNFVFRIIIERKLDVTDFNFLFVKYYLAYFQKSKDEGWEIKGYNSRPAFIKPSPIISTLFEDILGVKIDTYNHVISIKALFQLMGKKSSQQ